MAGVACPDLYFCSNKIFGLSDFSFKQFLQDTETVLVMFYNPNDSQSSCLAKEFSQASCENKRKNSAFASVDCSKYGYLCSKQGANDTPAFTVYSNGFKVGSVFNPSKANSKVLKMLIEKCPVQTEDVGSRDVPEQFKRIL